MMGSLEKVKIATAKVKQSCSVKIVFNRSFSIFLHNAKMNSKIWVLNYLSQLWTFNWRISTPILSMLKIEVTIGWRIGEYKARRFFCSKWWNGIEKSTSIPMRSNLNSQTIFKINFCRGPQMPQEKWLPAQRSMILEHRRKTLPQLKAVERQHSPHIVQFTVFKKRVEDMKI